MTIEDKSKKSNRSNYLRNLFIKSFTDQGIEVTTIPEAKNYFHAKQLYHERKYAEKQALEKKLKEEQEQKKDEL